MSPIPSLPSFREGVIFPPCEGGLKVGADFVFQVALRDITHPFTSHKTRHLVTFCSAESSKGKEQFILPARED